MSEDTRIINAISGRVIETNIRYFTTYNDLKAFIRLKWNIPTEQILILLPYGTKLKQSIFESYLSFNSNKLNLNDLSSHDNDTLNSSFLQKEFYVFDRRLFSLVNRPTKIDEKEITQSKNIDNLKKAHSFEDILQKADEILKEVVISETKVATELSLIKPVPSPLTETNFKTESSKSYHNITSVLVTNMGWLSALEIDVHYLQQLISDFSEDISNIIKCLFMANDYLKKYAFDVEQLYNSNVSFLVQLSDIKNGSKWSTYYNNVLDKLKALNGMNLQQYVNSEKLHTDFNLVNEIDRKVNNELLKIKKEIDGNLTERDVILDNIRQTEGHFLPLNDKYRLEDEMLEKFNELIDKLKLEIRQLLDKKMQDLSEDQLDEIATNTLSSKQKSTVGMLYTIAQALYTKVEDFLNQKYLLQEETVLVLGQNEKILTQDCNTQLKLYQNTIQHFTQVEDIPVIYGLYMIELYRQKLWFFNIVNDTNSFIDGSHVRTDKEVSMRDDWVNHYGLVASLFTDNIRGTSDFEYLKKLLSKAEKTENRDNNLLYNTQIEAEQLFSSIKRYIQELTETTINADVYNTLGKNFQDMTNLSLVLSHNNLENFENTEDRIRYYRERVRKLESILHDLYLNNSHQWPTGMLVMSFPKATLTDGNVSSTSTIGFPSFINKKSNINDRTLAVTRVDTDNLTKKIEEKQLEIDNQNRDLADLRLESAAYRETLTHLNQELFRLTTLREKSEVEQETRTLEYKESLEKLINQNIVSTTEIQKLNTELSESKCAYNALKEEQGTLSRVWNSEKEQLKLEIERLKGELSKRPPDNQTNTKEELMANSSTATDPNTKDVDTQTEWTTNTVSTQTGPETIMEQPPESSKQLELINKNRELQQIIFEIFRRNIYILENIGLLLTIKNKSDSISPQGIIGLSNDQLSIKRVKGLKKGNEQSLISSYSLHSHQYQEGENNKVIQSPIYHGIEQLLSQSKNDNQNQDDDRVLKFVKNIYDSNLYESAVIRRFNDIEILAKKLTKEIKSKKKSLANLQSEKITVKDFQIGDLALFLPTSDNHRLEDGYSVSSLNSSFSSVDISTPPHMTDMDNLINNNSPGVRSSTITDLNGNDKGHPWAAFTAFERDIKYFYYNQENQINLRNEEWFLGKITSLEKHIVKTELKDSTKDNPYKLPMGTIWYDVKAQVIIRPIF
ncbi:oligomeric, coiled-coil, peripheral membrane protein [Maudiozyma exigua]|uniref:Autophagy-related protein 11 n=1 Tax=Maudiozyma exigua TaxID=34358 RepID=A0A9P7B5Y7_MAUEX|nr:oligomeric, coiled-coil, peripheral membrane protein [Kazachstania exigua]